MRLRLLLALGILGALAFATVAAGGGGAKFKLRLTTGIAGCNASCPMDPSTIVITRVDGDGKGQSCRPFVKFTDCVWTARAGTKVVLDTTAAPPFNTHSWTGDCTGSGKCVLIADSNKGFVLNTEAP